MRLFTLPPCLVVYFFEAYDVINVTVLLLVMLTNVRLECILFAENSFGRQLYRLLYNSKINCIDNHSGIIKFCLFRFVVGD